MQQDSRFGSGSSRRIGGGTPAAAGLPSYRWAPRAWLLKGAAILFVWPLLWALLRGAFPDAAALAAGGALLFVGGQLIARGCAEDLEREGRTLAVSPLPWKTAGTAATAAAAFLISLGAAHDGFLMALLFGAFTAGGCVLAYGTDHRVDRAAVEEAARRAGIKAKDVIAALDEAHRKVREIEAASRNLRSRELKARLEGICAQARTILGQLEQKPKDLSRARRFLVTYLDGTHDVVTKYAAQQHDLAETPLAENFRRVLTTVEQVFAEQETLLRQDDHLDLEVQIEVLETQLKREGVH